MLLTTVWTHVIGKNWYADKQTLNNCRRTLGALLDDLLSRREREGVDGTLSRDPIHFT